MKSADARRFDLTSGLAPAGRQWLRLVENALGDAGIPAGCITPLIFIGRSGGGINQITLAEQLGLTGPSLVRLLDWLCESRLVRRDEDSSDRRAKCLSLTPEGETLAANFETRLTQLRAEVLGELSLDDIAAAIRLHDAIARAAQSLAASCLAKKRRPAE